jgi:CRP/FNR family cyclic AMP-dependent transcriptional regulator
MNVGAQNVMLKASDALNSCLIKIGKKEHFPPTGILFREGTDNVGVRLVVNGQVSLSLKKLPRLDRVFGSGSVLGLPSSFTGRPYSLTATVVAEAEVVQVTQADFLSLMRDRPDLCREATEMLGREMTFIHSALAERLRRTAKTRIAVATQGVRRKATNAAPPRNFSS